MTMSFGVRGVKYHQYKKAMSSVCHLCAYDAFPGDGNLKTWGEAHYLRRTHVYECIYAHIHILYMCVSFQCYRGDCFPESTMMCVIDWAWEEHLK